MFKLFSNCDTRPFLNPHILKIKTKRVGVFHILEDKHTLVAGFKAIFRKIYWRVFFGIGARVN